MTKEVSRADALVQLERIVKSKDFAVSDRTRSFFEYLVHAELNGKGEELRGTALAMDVFGRGADFDPNNDPVVRTEAVKLRKALGYYYLAAGAGDSIEISVPRGQYRPKFELRKHSPKQEKSTMGLESRLPTLGISAFSGSDTPRAKLFRDGLPEEIALELARFSHIRVLTGFPSENAAMENNEPQSPRPQCDYLLGGAVRDDGGNLRVIVQLKRTENGALVWSERKDISLDETQVFKAQEEISRQCAVSLADAYGVVATDIGGKPSARQSSDAGVYQALLAFHAHLRTSRVSSLEKMMELAQAATRNNDSSGLAHALVALGYVEEVALGRQRLNAILETGRSHAEKAVALEPQCPEALFAAAVYAQLDGDQSRFNRLIEAAIRSNPNGALLIALAGGWVALVGDTKKGVELVRQATETNPMLPIWTNITLCLEDVENGKLKAASEKVRRVDARDYASDWLIIAAVHGLAGETELAKEALSNFPTGQFTLDQFLSDLPYASGVIEMLRAGVEKL